MSPHLELPILLGGGHQVLYPAADHPHHLPHLVAQLGNTAEPLNCRLHSIHFLREVGDQKIILTLLQSNFHKKSTLNNLDAWN